MGINNYFALRLVTAANQAALPVAASDGELALVLDDGTGKPAIFIWDSGASSWILCTGGSVGSLVWQEPVIDKDISDPTPLTPSAGDRYIVWPPGAGAWTGEDNNIAEWDGASWDFTTVYEGFAVYVEDEDFIYVYTGASWVRMSTRIDHGLLLGLGDDDHTQYHNDARGDARYYTETESDANPVAAGAKIDKFVGTDNAVVRSDGITGDVQDSPKVTIDDTGKVVVTGDVPNPSALIDLIPNSTGDDASTSYDDSAGNPIVVGYLGSIGGAGIHNTSALDLLLVTVAKTDGTASKAILVLTGNVTGGAGTSGPVTLGSGTSTGNTGNASLGSGDAAVDSGDANLSSGDGNDTGDINVRSGDAVNDSGDVRIATGTAGGTRGDVIVDSPNWSANAAGDLAGNNLSGTNTGDEVQATETVAGKAELATQVETDAGTDDTRIVTPLKLRTTPEFRNYNARIATPYTAAASDDVITMNVAGASVVNLPTAVGIAGKVYCIKRLSAAGPNAVAVTPNGLETIDGAASVSLNAFGQSVSILSDGANWLIL
jgi:hypothetical protein